MRAPGAAGADAVVDEQLKRNRCGFRPPTAAERPLDRYVVRPAGVPVELNLSVLPVAAVVGLGAGWPRKLGPAVQVDRARCQRVKL